jgi:predicted Ser/Thr protein kinase
MALDKILHYDSKIAKAGLVLSSLTLPIWGIAAPLALLILIFVDIGQLIFQPDEVLKSCGYTFASLIAFLCGVVATGILKDNELTVSRDGITVPLFLALRNKYERFIDYHDITRIFIEGDVEGSAYDHSRIKLHLYLKSGGEVIINGRSLDALDLEHLLVSLTLWCEPAAINEKLIELKESVAHREMISGAGGASEEAPMGLVSYTKMWEDELSNRYSTTAFMPLSPGRRLLDGQLKVVRQLTFGGWSAVYLVQEANTRLRVLKESVLPASATIKMKEKAEAMFAKEAQILLRLSHPNIVKVHENFIEDGRHYMLLDYISGQNMRQLVKSNGAQHPFDVLSWAISLTEILIYLHGHAPPLIHRDLSPDNLVIDNDGNLILIDFGAANELLGTATGTLVGKQCYISPEQFRGKAQPASDLYSLGATMHYLLTGRDPEALSPSSPKTLVGYVSPGLDQIVRDLTASEPADRPASAHAARLRLLAVRDELKIDPNKEKARAKSKALAKT